MRRFDSFVAHKHAPHSRIENARGQYRPLHRITWMPGLNHLFDRAKQESEMSIRPALLQVEAGSPGVADIGPSTGNGKVANVTVEHGHGCAKTIAILDDVHGRRTSGPAVVLPA